MTTAYAPIVLLVWGLNALLWTAIALGFIFKKSKRTALGFLIGGMFVSFFMVHYMDQLFSSGVSTTLHLANAITYGIVFSFIPMDVVLMAYGIAAKRR